jgi:hypothetical protein
MMLVAKKPPQHKDEVRARVRGRTIRKEIAQQDKQTLVLTRAEAKRPKEVLENDAPLLRRRKKARRDDALIRDGDVGLVDVPEKPLEMDEQLAVH